jgi:hypothetical protein
MDRDWHPIATAPRDGTMLEVLVPNAAGGLMEGRAYFDQAAYDGSWWWEDTAMADYVHDPIEECNHGAPVYWRAIERPSDPAEWLARRFYMERPARSDMFLSWQEAQREAAPYVDDLRRFATMAVAALRRA